MKKFVYICICLMAMFLFASCSSDDDYEVGPTSLVGEWIDYDNMMLYIFSRDVVRLIDYQDSYYQTDYKYRINGNEIVFKLTNVDNSAELQWYKAKIEEIKQEMSTARGDRTQHLRDQLNEYTQKYRELKQQMQEETYSGKILTFNNNEFAFEIDGLKYVLHKINN